MNTTRITSRQTPPPGGDPPGAAAGPPRPSRYRPGRRGGFTLIEAALVTMIVGIGVTAIIAAQQAFHQENAWAQRMGTALLLASEIRESTLHLPQRDPIQGTGNWGPESNEPTVADYDDLDDFDGSNGAGLVISPPVDAARQPIPDMERWSQEVTVENVLKSYVNADDPAPDGSTPVVRITCRVLYNGPRDDEPQEVTRLTWLRTGDR